MEIIQQTGQRGNVFQLHFPSSRQKYLKPAWPIDKSLLQQANPVLLSVENKDNA